MGLPGWGAGLPPARDSGTQAPSACGSTLFTMWLGVPSVQLADGETKDEDTHALVNRMGPEVMRTTSSHNPLARVSHMTLPRCKRSWEM